MASYSQPNDRQEVINRRLPYIIGILVSFSALLVFSLSRFQWLAPDVEREFRLRGEANTSSIRRLPAERGFIYDRDGQPLAFNAIEYAIGVSPNLVTDPVALSRELGVILNGDVARIYELVTASVPWVQIARPVSAQVGQEIAALDEISVTIEPLLDRFYPQGALAGPVIGFVIEDRTGQNGALGVEDSYNDHLAGRVQEQEISTIPLAIPLAEQTVSQRGRDVVLTIDRDVQHLVEEILADAVDRYEARGGTIIVMNPTNGDILAMASQPTFDPNAFADVSDQRTLTNPAISNAYEPGSVMKVLTVAAALDSGTITPNWTYNDQGVIDQYGVRIENWDDQAHGAVDLSTALVRSLNVGMATISLEMGYELFYSRLRMFGVGLPTRVDLPGESAGILKVPGDSDWSESDLLTNSFGQGVSVTPLQMLTAVNAIAADGLMYQPRVVQQIVDGENVIDATPSVLSRPISSETAQIVTDMMVRVIEDPEGAELARLPGWTVAGKTGTAQIPTPTGTYDPTGSIATFVGFLPADDPQISILVKLDRPSQYWGSRVAAPVFRQLAERLVIMLGIPNDEVRRTLDSSRQQMQSE